MVKKTDLVDTRIVYCGDCYDQLRKLPQECVDLIYIDPPFNSNRNYEVFWGETKEKRAFEDRHESTKAYIEFMRPRCVELARVLKTTGSFYYHCDWHASLSRIAPGNLIIQVPDPRDMRAVASSLCPVDGFSKGRFCNTAGRPKIKVSCQPPRRSDLLRRFRGLTALSGARQLPAGP